MKKETREFFAQDNRLNKGYANSSLKESDKSFFRKRFEHLFPPVDVLQAFEDLHEGSVERIIEMAEKEQKGRQKIQEARMLVEERIAKISIFAEIFMMIAVCYTVVVLAKSSFYSTAIFFTFAAFLTKFLIYRKKFDTYSGRRGFNHKSESKKR